MTIRRFREVSWILSVLFVSSLAVAQQPPQREIIQIKGDLYRFRNRGHFSVFLVTPAGIIATDPISAEAAVWLKEELTKHFAKPLKYLIYSHDHADHISGGEIFSESVVIAHENAGEVILGERRPTAAPQLIFSDKMAVELGGKKVELIYVGKNHSDNSIVMRFPEEKVLFAVDFVQVESLPFRDFPDAYIEDWIESLKKVEAMDFEILAPGHGPLGKKDDVRRFRHYMEELRREVLQHLRQGRSVEEIKQLVKMEKYSQWNSYQQFLTLNIEGMACHLQMHRRPN